MTQLTTNFSLEEFNSKDGEAMPTAQRECIKEVARQLQIIRDHIGKAIHINSGYRSPAYNKKIGGASNSFHVKGMAVDVRVDGMTPSELAAVITALMIDGKIIKGGIGKYSTFVHYDIRGTHTRFK